VTDLSVVLPVYNGKAFIERSLSELIEYVVSLKELFSLIVIDDGSTDPTGELIAATVASAPVPIPVIQGLQNAGKGAAIGGGMAVAQGRYRLFLEADLDTAP